MTITDTAPPTAPMAPRLRRPSWRDPRLLIGLVLLLAAVAVGARVVALADHSRPVYAARVALPSGTPLTADALQIVRLRLAGTDAAYLSAEQPLPTGQVLLRPVGAGEIVPLAAVGDASRIQSRPVSIPFDGEAPAGLGSGGLVDVWASAKRRDAVGGGFVDPQPIAHGVEVFSVRTPGSGLTATGGGSVEVLLPTQDLAAVLDALANQARVVVLPVPGSMPGRGAGS